MNVRSAMLAMYTQFCDDKLLCLCSKSAENVMQDLAVKFNFTKRKVRMLWRFGGFFHQSGGFECRWPEVLVLLLLLLLLIMLVLLLHADWKHPS